MILVTGATGRTGSRVVAQLCCRGLDTRALVRTGEAAAGLPAEAQVVVGSFEDPATLEAAVSGCSGVYLVSRAGPDQERQEGAVIDAVRRSGTGAHIVKVAALGLGLRDAGRICVQHGRIRDILAASGLPWTVLALSQLMHNLFLHASAVLERGVLPVPAGDARIAWVEADDVAAVAVEVLSTPGHVGRIYEVTGPEALHHDDVAALLSAVAGREVRYLDVPADTAVDAMVAAGVPEWTARGVVETHQYYRTGAAANPTDVVSRLTARTSTTVAQFLELTAHQWSGPAARRAAASPSRRSQQCLDNRMHPAVRAP